MQISYQRNTDACYSKHCRISNDAKIALSKIDKFKVYGKTSTKLIVVILQQFVLYFSIMKMYETGVYKYVHSLILPPMPKCAKRSVFHSARLLDLMTAFGILCFGIFIAIIIFIGECLWKEKRKIYELLKKERVHQNVIHVRRRGIHYNNYNH